MGKAIKATAKALTWRAIGTAEVFAIAYVTTGAFESASHIAGLTAVTSTVLYIGHDYIWSLVRH